MHFFLQFRNICLRFNAFFFTSRCVFGSVILQSKGTLSSPPTPPPGQGSKTSATKLGNVSSVASSYSRKERYHPPHPPTPPPGQGSKTSATKLGNVSSVASSYNRKERYHPLPHPPTPAPRQGTKTSATKLGNVSSVASTVILQSKGTLSSPPHPPTPLPVKVARRQQQSWATCLR